MPNNPRSIERDNQNELRKFPFADSASCTNGACVIVPGAIIDAQLYIPGRDPSGVWMSEITSAGILKFSDGAGEFAETCLSITPNAAVPVTFTGDGGPLPGGVVVFGKEEDVRALVAIGGQAFTESQTTMSPATTAWPGLPGVTGFRLDDGHVVFGQVKIKGRNGCEVSSYEDADKNKRLRISAVGEDVESTEVTGFITRVVADSDNTNFVVSKNRSDHTVDIFATGVSSVQDASLNADQNDVCAAVKRARGTSMSKSATVKPGCDDRVCTGSITPSHRITFVDGYDTIGSEPLTVFEGDYLGTLPASYIPDAARHPGMRFLGYFDRKMESSEVSGMRLYFRYNGTGVGRFTETSDITLYAHWIERSSRVEVTFNGYGTLHLAAPDLPAYDNPIIISGVSEPIPEVTEIPEEALKNGGADALADIVLRPAVPGGSVSIGIRGIEKAHTT